MCGCVQVNELWWMELCFSDIGKSETQSEILRLTESHVHDGAIRSNAWARVYRRIFTVIIGRRKAGHVTGDELKKIERH